MTPLTKFYHVTQITLQMRLCDQSLLSSVFVKEVIITSVLRKLNQKNRFAPFHIMNRVKAKLYNQKDAFHFSIACVPHLDSIILSNIYYVSISSKIF